MAKSKEKEKLLWKCPACGGGNLEVQVVAWARLKQYEVDGEVTFETIADEAVDQGHHWDENDPMVCRECGERGEVGQFRVEEGEEECQDEPSSPAD